MGRLPGLDTGEAHLPIKDLSLITPLEAKQVNSKLIAACQTLTISRDSHGYSEHPVIKLLDKTIKLFFF